MIRSINSINKVKPKVRVMVAKGRRKKKHLVADMSVNGGGGPMSATFEKK